MGRRRLALVIAMVAVGCLVACGEETGSVATPTTLPDRVAAMWAEESPWVAVAPAEDLYVPGPDLPARVRVEALTQRGAVPPDAEIQPVPGPEDAAQTLYADPTLAEPWAERAVMVGRVAGSDIEGSFAPREATTAVTIQGTEGRVGRHGDLWYAAWPIPTCDVCTQEAFVIGYGLTREGVLAIAETVRQHPVPQADPATLPDGLEALGSAPGTQGSPTVDVWPQAVVMRAGQAVAQFQIWSGDRRLYAHLAFWSPDGEPIQTWRRGWMDVVEHGEVTIAISSTLESPDPPEGDVETLLEAAAALVPGDAAAVDAALAAAAENLAPLDGDRNLCEGVRGVEGRWATLSGVVDHLRWGLTLQVVDGTFAYCNDLWFTTSGGGPASAGGGPLGPVPAEGVRFADVGTTVHAEGSSATLVAGDVPDSAVRVVATMNGISTEAELAEVGPEPGRHWFAAAFPSGRTSGTIEVVAHDQAGAPVASGTAG